MTPKMRSAGRYRRLKPRTLMVLVCEALTEVRRAHCEPQPLVYIPLFLDRHSTIDNHSINVHSSTCCRIPPLEKEDPFFATSDVRKRGTSHHPLTRKSFVITCLQPDPHLCVCRFKGDSISLKS